MRLQDLTTRDMWAYVRSILRSGGPASGPDFPDRMLRYMVSKAEGVFLWLHLATRSLLQGWENGDDMTELESRLEALPGGLAELYADIWSRLNDDSAIYRKVAAEYFRLLIDAKSLESAPKWVTGEIFPWAGDLTLVQFMVLTTRRIWEKALDPSIEASLLLEKDETIDTLCHETEASIQRRCAGLVEVRTRSLSNNSDARRPNHRVVTFIHRTAYDFMTDSEEGLGILSFYECRKEERYLHLTQGLLASCRFGESPTFNTVSAPLLHVRFPDFKARTFEVLRTAWRFWDAGQYPRFVQPEIEPPHFISVAAAQGFTEFALSTISQANQPEDLATEVLIEFLAIARFEYDILSGIPLNGDFLQSLLRLGADLNSRSPRINAVSETTDFAGLEVTPYRLCVTLAVEIMDRHKAAAKGLLSVVLQTGVTPHGRVVFGIHIGPKGPVLMGDHASERQRIGMKRHSHTQKYPSFRKQELVFVIDSSLAFLLEIARCRLSEYMTAADMGVDENPRLGAGTCSRDICVPFVHIRERSPRSRVVSTWRIVDGRIRAGMASLFRRWLLPGDDSWMGMNEELIGVGHKVNLDISGRSKAYKRFKGSLTHVFGAERCCSGRGCAVDEGPRAKDGGP